MVLQNDQKSYAENSDANLFAVLAESLKQPLNGIARTAELLKMHGNELTEQSPEMLESIFSTSTQTLRLLDHYQLNVRLQQADKEQILTPVSIASVLAETAHQLETVAHKQRCDIELVIAGRYEPVLAHGAGLSAALYDLGSILLEGQSEAEVHGRSVLKLAVHRTHHGIVAGLFSSATHVNAGALKRARQLQGKARAPFNQLTATTSAGLFIADALLSTMSTGLRVARYQRTSGLAATFLPSNQLSIV